MRTEAQAQAVRPKAKGVEPAPEPAEPERTRPTSASAEQAELKPPAPKSTEPERSPATPVEPESIASSEHEKAVEHLMPVKPVEPAARGEVSPSAGSAEAAALPQAAGRVELVKAEPQAGAEHGREKRKGRKGSRTRPKAAAKRAAKPAGTGPARDEHSGVPRDHHAEHGGSWTPAPQRHAPAGGGPDARPASARATALVGEGPDGPDGGLAGDGPLGPGEGEGEGTQGPAGLTPAQAFDALYAFTAPGLVRQTYLLTGRRALAKESVERAFHKAWEQWPEVAKDRDPVGWVRAAAYEYALSPWHRLRRSHRHPDAPPAEPEDRKLLDTLLSLPPSYRRTLVLYDGVGLDLPETAAETEASTPAAANRLVHAREAIAERLPELADPAELQRRLDELACAEKLGTGKAPAVRGEGERRVRFWTRAAIAFTALIIGASAITWITSAKDYEPPVSPGQKVTGVPPRPGPQVLDPQEKELREKLRKGPGSGPERVRPLAE